MRRFIGPTSQQDAVITGLKNLDIPTHKASAYEDEHETGYLGLTITRLFVDIDIGDEEKEKKMETYLETLGFKETD
jgi:hypothetical protein